MIIQKLFKTRKKQQDVYFGMFLLGFDEETKKNMKNWYLKLKMLKKIYKLNMILLEQKKEKK